MWKRNKKIFSNNTFLKIRQKIYIFFVIPCNSKIFISTISNCSKYRSFSQTLEKNFSISNFTTVIEFYGFCIFSSFMLIDISQILPMTEDCHSRSTINYENFPSPLKEKVRVKSVGGKTRPKDSILFLENYWWYRFDSFNLPRARKYSYRLGCCRCELRGCANVCYFAKMC